MKKIYYLIAMAVMAFTFTSCEDVPEPFGQPINPNSGADAGTADPAGSGTATDPYNVAGILDYTKSLGADVTSPNDVYFTGIITEVGEAYGTNFGNATFRIGDTEKSKSTFYCYRCMYLGNVKYTDEKATNIKVGDKVVVCGKVVNYKGSTPETSANAAYVVSINGTGGGDTPSPTPSGDVKSVSVADFLAAATSTSDWYELTGTIKNMKEDGSDKYGNFDIEDATGSVYVYGLLAEKGGEKGKFQELVAAKGIANGKKITIIGNRAEYQGKAQVGNAYFVKIEDGGDTPTPTPSGDGDGSEAKPYNVAAAIAAGSGSTVFVKAYIVGWIEGQVLSEGAHFDANATVATNILIADTPDETDVTKCMPVQLPSGAVRNAVNLKDNAGNFKKEILLNGNIEKYFGAPGIKGTAYAKIGDTEAGTKPGGGDTPTPPSGDAQVVTIAQFNAAAESNDVWYQLTGTISNLKDGDKYGNFDITDETGSVYVYGLLSEKGGAKQKFQELVAAKGIANNKKITIIGNRGSYNGKIEVVNAYFVSIE